MMSNVTSLVQDETNICPSVYNKGSLQSSMDYFFILRNFQDSGRKQITASGFILLKGYEIPEMSKSRFLKFHRNYMDVASLKARLLITTS